MIINKNIIPYIVLVLSLTIIFLIAKYQWNYIDPNVTSDNETTNLPSTEDGRIVLIDVRTEQEYHTKHRPGAINLPLTKIATMIQDEVPNRTTPIMLYCRSGKRAQEAKEILESLGYEHVENLHNTAEKSI